MPQDSIYLIGFMGAGKTTIGNLLEKRGYSVIDIDERIVEEEKMEITDIFNQYGENYFRNIESNILRKLKGEASVITTGGGIILKEENRQFLKDSGKAIFLQCSPEVVQMRLEKDTTRPLIKDKSLDDIREMYNQRLPLYLECADITIDTSEESIEAILEEIVKRMNSK